MTLPASSNPPSPTPVTPSTMALPPIRPEHMFYPDGNVILGFCKNMVLDRARRTTRYPTTSTIFMRASTEALHSSDVLTAMVHDAKVRQHEEYTENGYIVIDLPADDWEVWAFFLLLIRGTTEAELDETFFNLVTLGNLHTMANKWNLMDIVKPYGDYFIRRAWEGDESILGNIATYIWHAQVFGADQSHIHLTALAQSNCTGIRTAQRFFVADDELGPIDRSAICLPKWVKDAILSKRRAAFSIIRRTLAETRKMLRDEGPKGEDIECYVDVDVKCEAIDNLASMLGIPLEGRMTDAYIEGRSYNQAYSILRRLRGKYLEHGCKGECKHEFFYRVLPEPVKKVGRSKRAKKTAMTKAAKNKMPKWKPGCKEKTKKEGGEPMFDPVSMVLRSLESAQAWKDHGSTKEWGFGLDERIKRDMDTGVRCGWKRKRC